MDTEFWGHEFWEHYTKYSFQHSHSAMDSLEEIRKIRKKDSGLGGDAVSLFLAVHNGHN